jgi:hypothetical protein
MLGTSYYNESQTLFSFDSSFSRVPLHISMVISKNRVLHYKDNHEYTFSMEVHSWVSPQKWSKLLHSPFLRKTKVLYIYFFFALTIPI